MLDKITRVLQDATDAFKAQAANLGEGAKEKSEQLIDDWLQIFPKLQKYGLQINSFALQIAFSPSLEAEFLGHHHQFTMERLDEILNDCKGNTALVSVFTTIKTTYVLHQKTRLSPIEPLIVRLRIKIAPEIKVYIGKPLLD